MVLSSACLRLFRESFLLLLSNRCRGFSRSYSFSFYDLGGDAMSLLLRGSCFSGFGFTSSNFFVGESGATEDMLMMESILYFFLSEDRLILYFISLSSRTWVRSR